MLKSKTEEQVSHTEPLDVRVFKSICLITMLTSVLVVGVNLIANNPMVELLYATVLFVTSGSFLYLSAVYENTRYLRALLIIVDLLILIGAWSTNQGYEGSTPYFLYLLASITIVVAPPSDRWYLFGLVCAVIAGLFYMSIEQPSFTADYPSEQHRFIDISLSFFLSLFVGTLLFWLVLRENQIEKQRSADLYEQVFRDKIELEKLLNEISVLKGILPICSFCKKIRDEDDTWQVLEQYISVHSEAQFSHGYCPECISTHYPEFKGK